MATTGRSGGGGQDEAAYEALLRQLRAVNERLALSSVHLQEEAERAEQRAAELEGVLASLAEGLVIYGPTGKIVRLNRAAQALLGNGASGVGGERPPAEGDYRLRVESAAGRPLPAAELPAQRALRGETVRDVVLVLQHRARTIWVLASAAPICGANGHCQGAVMTLTDITDRKQLEHERARAERLQREFLFLVSHELRTPLTVLVGNLGLAQQQLAGAEGDEAQQAVARIEAAKGAAWQLSEMVEGLLDVTAIESGRLALVWEPVCLPGLIREVLQRLAPALAQHQVETHVPRRFPLLQADRRRIGQVLSNLLSNAAKYSPPGTKISLRLQKKGTQAIVSLRDEGPGIPQAAIPGLFDRFSRVHVLDVGLREGLGLGLYINKAAVEAHGGKMWVESKPGQGSAFYFALPLA